MSDNIFSFEEYREKKLGRKHGENPLDELFRKDLRDQRDLLDWYSFHNIFNKHKLFVHTLFLENHVDGRKNPNSGYVVCYNGEQLKTNTKKIAEAIEWEGRNPVIVNATDKTFRQVGQTVTGLQHSDNYKTSKKIKDLLLRSNKVFVFHGISMMKGTTQEKIIHVLLSTFDFPQTVFDTVHKAYYNPCFIPQYL
ncbi:MAG: hypothetical protein M1609_09075 [Firmicutes bacterium]|nr:hypothetical protein [Bacillota bacterium]